MYLFHIYTCVCLLKRRFKVFEVEGKEENLSKKYSKIF